MPRSPRVELAGGLHHVTSRAPKGLVLFREPLDRIIYLEHLAAEIDERGWSLRSYVFMTNHVHHLVMTPEPDLGAGFKGVHERFARRMHGRYAGHGHVFGARFDNSLVTTRSYELACLRYIARNPVKAGLCADPADWRWGSHRALIGLEPPPPFLDAAAVLETVPMAAYRDLAEMPDRRLLDRLAAQDGDAWMIEAKDEHLIPVNELAEHLGVDRATVYRRLKRARATEGTGP